MLNKDVYGLISRYLFLLLFGLFGLNFLYVIFTPLTIYPVFWILRIFDIHANLLIGNVLFFKGLYAEIIPACIAGAAYYLLLMLNMATPMKPRQRAKSLALLISSFLILNILRIGIFMGLYVKGFKYFEFAHRSTWYFGSTIMIVLVWFANAYLLKIKTIPVYTDAAKLLKDAKGRKRLKVKIIKK